VSALNPLSKKEVPRTNGTLPLAKRYAFLLLALGILGSVAYYPLFLGLSKADGSSSAGVIH